MPKTFLIGGSQSKPSLLGSLFGNNQYKSAPFRVRRNKWSIIKFILLASLTIYLLLLLRSFLFSDDESDRELQESLTRAKPKPSHSPLQNDIEGQESAYQISPEPTYKQKSENDIHPSNHLPSITQLDQISTSSTSLSPYRAGSIEQRRRKKPIADSLDAKKRRLDDQLKILLPVVSGWGELGKGVELTSAKDKEKAAEVFKQGAYNVYISDRISPNRTLHSVVADECNYNNYDVDELPNVSVIIIFTNEIFSALVRTVWSVINRTPKKLLKEIILVDDFSDKEYLKSTLRDYIDVYWNTLPHHYNDKDLVKLIHLPERLGLIKARLIGAKAAEGDVLLFLDSHCEATEKWLEPLVQRIKENRRVFICPVIDIINDRTLEYNAVDPYFFQLGGFDWTGHFTWINRRDTEAKEQPTTAAKSPTMAGGLFAVDRKYFFEVGSYDEDMKIWGGENLELSFRVWQCGGRVEIHPCSHVGHIFRNFHPYSFNGLDSHGFNTLRTVLVWMDEYSKYFFMSRPDLLKVDAGNLTSRKELRKKLDCKSFKWYLDNVYDKRKFIYDDEVLAYGWIRNKKSNLCIDVLNKQETKDETAGLYPCEEMKHPLNVTTNQLFSYSKNKEIRREEGCLTIERHKDVDNNEDNNKSEFAPIREHKPTYTRVLMSTCQEPEYETPSQKRKAIRKRKLQTWQHVPVSPRSNNRFLINAATGECLTTEGGTALADLLATACDKDDPSQYWEFQIYTDTKTE